MSSSIVSSTRSYTSSTLSEDHHYPLLRNPILQHPGRRHTERHPIFRAAGGHSNLELDDFLVALIPWKIRPKLTTLQQEAITAFRDGRSLIFWADERRGIDPHWTLRHDLSTWWGLEFFCSEMFRLLDDCCSYGSLLSKIKALKRKRVNVGLKQTDRNHPRRSLHGKWTEHNNVRFADVTIYCENDPADWAHIAWFLIQAYVELFYLLWGCLEKECYAHIEALGPYGHGFAYQNVLAAIRRFLGSQLEMMIPSRQMKVDISYKTVQQVAKEVNKDLESNPEHTENLPVLARDMCHFWGITREEVEIAMNEAPPQEDRPEIIYEYYKFEGIPQASGRVQRDSPRAYDSSRPTQNRTAREYNGATQFQPNARPARHTHSPETEAPCKLPQRR